MGKTDKIIVKKMLKGCLTGSCLGQNLNCKECKYVKWAKKKYGFDILAYFDDVHELNEIEKYW